MHASLKRTRPRPAVDDRKSADEGAKTASRPSRFHNDPEDPANPNETRERHLKKIKR